MHWDDRTGRQHSHCQHCWWQQFFYTTGHTEHEFSSLGGDPDFARKSKLIFSLMFEEQNFLAGSILLSNNTFIRREESLLARDNSTFKLWGAFEQLNVIIALAELSQSMQTYNCSLLVMPGSPRLEEMRGNVCWRCWHHNLTEQLHISLSGHAQERCSCCFLWQTIWNGISPRRKLWLVADFGSPLGAAGYKCLLRYFLDCC